MTSWRQSARRAALAALLIPSALLLLGPYEARGEDFAPPELPFTHKYGFSARAAGLGYAYGAVAEDASALYFNPAGLAQIRRIELGAGAFHNAQSRLTTFDTASDGFAGTGLSETDVSTSQTELTHLNFAYPFPTYRGSLVVGFGYQRLAPLDSDYLRQGILGRINLFDGRARNLQERERFRETGSLDYYTLGLGGDISPNISVGGSVSLVSGSTTQFFSIGRYAVPSAPDSSLYGSLSVFESTSTADADITGWTWSAGVLGHAGESVRLGLTIFGKERLTLDGHVTTRMEDGEKSDPPSRFGFEDKIKTPISTLGSLAFTRSNFLLAADLRFTDWTQIDYEGVIESAPGENAYRSTLDISIGAEYQLLTAPARIRAGVSRQPLPYRVLPADVAFHFVPDDGNANTTDDTSYFIRDYPEARLETDRYFVTIGAGALLEDALSLDFAYVHGIYERSGGGFSEKWTSDRVYGTASVRF